MDRIIDIAQDSRHLRRDRGFMLVEEQGREIGRVALDEIYALIIHAHGVTYSNSLLASLAEVGALVVICGNNHFPIALISPLSGHYAQGGRMQAQWQAGKPLHKQLWRQVVIAKINMQIAALKAQNQNAARLETMAKRVKSGDPENLEAQAARFYWPLLMGENFRRDRSQGGTNALLNYGYTILRAAIARNLIASGLNPSIGIHHSNQYNAFALVDDIMEPFRPLVDVTVLGLIKSGIEEVTPASKKVLASLIALDLDLGKTRSPLSTAAAKMCFSLAQSFESRKAALDLPRPPSEIEFSAMGRINVDA